MNDDKTWPDLVAPSYEGGQRLVASLTEYLQPRIAVRRRKYTPERRRAAAEKLVGEVGAHFILALDPSLATAVAHYREMRLLTVIVDQTTELVALARVRQDKAKRLALLPHRIADYAMTLLEMDESVGLHLLDALTGPTIEAARIVPELLVEPPRWLDRLPPLGWIALAEFAAAFGETATASDLYERAALFGAPDRPRLLAKAGAAAYEAGAAQRAGKLLERARAIAHGTHPFVEAEHAAIAGDTRGILAAADGANVADDPELAALVAQAHAMLDNLGQAIRLLRDVSNLNPGASSVRLLLAQYLWERAKGKAIVLHQADLAEAFDVAIEARDLRRPWRGDSASAVAVACAAAGLMRRLDLVLTIGLEAPDGTATKEEAGDERVLTMVVLAATTSGDFTRATATIEKISDPFTKALARAELATNQGNVDDAVTLYGQAWELARADSDRAQVQIGLAELGTWPLPDHEELEASDDATSAWVLATAQNARGDEESAIARLLTWRNRHLPCANLVAAIRRGQGDVDGAVEVLRDAASIHRTPEPLIGAAQILTDADRFSEAESLVNEAMPEATTSNHRRALIEVLAAAAQARQSWVQLERHARALAELDPLDTDVRWLVVGSIYNQRRFEDAWHEATQGAPLDPTSEARAVVWIDLRRRFDPSLAAWRQFIDLHKLFPDSEDVHAAVIISVFQMRIEDDPPPELVEAWNSVRDRFFLRYPDSNWAWRIDTGSTPEELIDALRPILRAQSEQYDTVRRDVSAGRMPYGLLALLTGRPYALALAATAAGCHVAHPAHPATAENESSVAANAFGQTVVADASVLHLLSYLPDLVPVVLGAFRSIRLLDATFVDLRLASDDLSVVHGETLGWDLERDLPLLTEITDAGHQEALKRVSFMLDTADLFTRTSHPQPLALDDLPDDCDHLMPWLGPVDYAKHTETILFSDDAALRALARGVGRPAFGTLALLQALADDSRLNANIDEIHLELRRHGFVDLPPNAEHIRLLSEEVGWKAPSVGSFAFSRPALWAAGPPVARVFTACLHRAQENAPDTVSAWLAAGTYGAGAGQGPLEATRRAVLLLLQALSVAGADPATFAQLASGIRDAASLLDAPDPLPITLRWLFARVSEDEDRQTAAALVIHVASEMDEDVRNTAREIAFGL